MDHLVLCKVIYQAMNKSFKKGEMGGGEGKWVDTAIKLDYNISR